MSKSSGQKHVSLIIGIVLLTGLYFTIRVNYLLFHTLAEFFSIVVASSVFIITWNSREYIKNRYLLLIGIAYLFIAFIDLMHTLSYQGMNIFTDYDYYANQLWIGARYMESLTLLTAFFLLKRKKGLNSLTIAVTYLLVTAALIISVFIIKIFPVCFIEGEGQTLFKLISEFVICIVLSLSLVLLRRRKKFFDESIYRLLFMSIVFTIISELAFTFYIDNYGFSNIIGHYFKIFSFYLIYKAIIQTGIMEPTSIIFREIDSLNTKLNKALEKEQKQNSENEKLIKELTEAMEKVHQLSGLLPICMHCKKVRDDSGYWNRIEEYISRNSEADFSHSICPDCVHKYYPEIEGKSHNDDEKS